MPVDFFYKDDEGTFRCRMQTRRCAYRFPNGEECKNETVIGLQYCWQHLETELHLRIIRENRIPKGVVAWSRRHERLHFKKNEYVLKHFFRSADPKDRIPVSVENHITKNDSDSISSDPTSSTNIPVDVRYV